MILGVISDSHGDAEMTRKAVELLLVRGATKLVHCGDVCGQGVIDALVGHDCVLVWGNCDEPTAAMTRYLDSVGLRPPTGPMRFEADGKSIGVCHGHEISLESFSIGLDYLFYGHTHKCDDQRIGKCRVINPGALYRARTKTVAALDLKEDSLHFWRVDTGERLSI